MPTPLHDIEVLRALSESAEGPARDWASLRLALAEPTGVTHLPDNPWEATLCLATPAPDLEALVLARLQGGVRDPHAARLADTLLAFGHPVSDPQAWIHALDQLDLPAGHRAHLWVARVRADLGALDAASLAACTEVRGPEALAAVPALVLRYAAAAGHDLAPIADDIAAQLADAVAADPDLVGTLMTWLGQPALQVTTARDPARSAQLGAAAAGGTLPALTRRRGSARGRTQALVRGLLDAIEGPAAALLVALSAARGAPHDALAAQAGWLASCVAPADPVLAVLHGAGEDRVTLAAARAAVRPDDIPRVAEGLLDPNWRRCPLAVVATPLLFEDEPEPALTRAAVARATVDVGFDERLDALLTVALARDPERLVALLADPRTVQLALAAARTCPTEEVLQALLAMPVPAEPVQRSLYALALAEMADPAVEAPLVALARADDSPGVGHALRRAEALFGRPLSTG